MDDNFPVYRINQDTEYSWNSRSLILSSELTQVPIFDGSAREWVEVIEEVGLKVAMDGGGNSCGKVAPFLNEPVCVWNNDSFVAAFPHSEVKITYGIHFSQVASFSISSFGILCWNIKFQTSVLLFFHDSWCVENWFFSLHHSPLLCFNSRVTKFLHLLILISYQFSLNFSVLLCASIDLRSSQ